MTTDQKVEGSNPSGRARDFKTTVLVVFIFYKIDYFFTKISIFLYTNKKRRKRPKKQANLFKIQIFFDWQHVPALS